MSEKTLQNELDFGSDNDEELPPKPVKYMDENEESESDEDNISPKKKKSSLSKKVVKKNNKVKPIIGDRPISDYIFASVNNYSFKSWKQCFPNDTVTLRSLIFNPEWDDFFDVIEKKPYFKRIETILSDHLKRNEETIVPHAELVFNSFNILSPKKIKVVIVGQDPYPNAAKINGKHIPQAMGFSFSVPFGYPQPPSLEKIYANLVEFGHFKKIPDGGCLAGWILQGMFMINASLTTFFCKRNAHRELWKNFTYDLLAYLNNKCNNLVFLVWGADAHNTCINIDPYRHHVITSSHPSPLGFHQRLSGKTYGKVNNPASYPPFKSTDHFGRMNSYLLSVGKKEIFLDVIDV